METEMNSRANFPPIESTVSKSSIIPYGKHLLDHSDLEAVMDALQSNYLTTGPLVEKFENELKQISCMKYAVVVSNGTAALHCAMGALQLSGSDEVIVTDLSFVASANAILYVNVKPVFADIDLETMNIDPDHVESLITINTRAIVAVDYAGQLCNYPKLREIANRHHLKLIRDGAHSLGLVTPEVDLVTYSFHPVKHITTGEGGAIVTDDEELYQKLKQFRNHGIDQDYHHRHLHYYDMISLGYNYRLTDFQCALGISQLKKLPDWIQRRREIAHIYDTAFQNYTNYFVPLANRSSHVYHLYVIKLNSSIIRDDIYLILKDLGLGVNVHYKPIHLQSYYQELGYPSEICPNARECYNRIITLPLHPSMTDSDINRVITSLIGVFDKNENGSISEIT